ncbi:hypothetical protein V8B55DRAFT_1524418 [Mucor lusitanicus]
MSSNNNNSGEKDVSLVQQNNSDTASPSTSSPNTNTNANSDEEEVITQLTLAGLKVLMVRKRDQIIYKLPDNMQVAAIGDEQRQQLMKEIQSLHAATMAAAANAQQQQQQQQQQQKPSDIKPIAPRSESFNPLDTPPKPTAAEADAIKETARKLREELEQQQQLQMLQQSQKPGNAAAFDPNDNKSSTRKYNKTGKYSKKRQQQLQQQLYQQLQQQYPQQQQLTQQQLLALQQSLQQQTTINTGYDNRSSSTTPMTGNTTATSTPLSSAPNSSFPFPAIAQQQAQQTQQQDGSAKSSPVPPTPPPVPIQQKTLPPADSILSKRLPEEELQHREVKKRCVESLLADHRSVTFPDYEKPFTSVQDAMKRLMPYHIYQYPKGDLDANKIPLERQDHTMIEIFKCQSDMFEKHGNISKKIEKNDGKLSLKIMVERQVLAEQRQKLTEEQNRVQAEQAAQHQELMRLQTEKARIEQEAKQQQQQQQIQPQTSAQLQPQQQLQQILQQILPPQALEQLQLHQQQQQQQPNSATAAANYANGLAQATALLQNPQFVNQYSQLSPDLQAKLLRNREQLVALIEKQQNPSSANNNNSGSQQP